MSEIVTDYTWPHPLPTDQAVDQVFFNELGASSKWNPEEHIARVRKIVFSGEAYSRITRSLHELLSVQSYYNDPRLSARDVIRGSKEMTPLIKHTGIDRYADLRKKVLPQLRISLADVMTDESEPQEKLDTTALTMGTITAEAQSFSDANTRIARTLHDYIKGGPSALKIERIGNTKRSFLPPVNIEQLIMMQNLTQLVEHPDEVSINDRGVMAISDHAIELYMQAEGFMQNVWRQDDFEWNAFNDKEKLEEKIALQRRVEGLLPQIDLEDKLRARSVLMQKHYAPAALAATFTDSNFDFTPESVEKLVETNIDLMRMRVFSLGVGMARRGIFMSVEKEGPSLFVEHKWLPNVDSDL